MLLKVCYISQISGQWSRKPEQLCVNPLIIVGCLDVWHTAMKMTWLNDDYVDFMTNRCRIWCLCFVQKVLHLPSFSNNKCISSCSQTFDLQQNVWSSLLLILGKNHQFRQEETDWHAKRPTTVFVQKTKFSFSIHFLSEILYYKNKKNN